jgi:hypothetical protein
MHALEPAITLDLSDVGERCSPFKRALLLVEAGCTESDRITGDPREWTIGAVNKALLELRAFTFGRRLELLANCPECGAICESELDCLDMAEASNSRIGKPLTIGKMIYRLPTCADVIAAGRSDQNPALALARRLKTGGSAELDDAKLRALADAVSHADPLSLIEVALTCPECDARWSEPLHIADVVWTELQSRADRLIFDIARLAQAFAWRESDILAMSAQRRQRYLELLPS